MNRADAEQLIKFLVEAIHEGRVVTALEAIHDIVNKTSDKDLVRIDTALAKAIEHIKAKGV